MSNSTIMNQTLPVNADKKKTTIIRVVHNRVNPFVQLHKKSLWDENLSLKAVGLWARCMSRPDDWHFCITELVKKCKEGRRSVDNAMKELIDAGYVYKIECIEKGEKGRFKGSRIEYVFFEFPATQEEKDRQLEIFKKSFRHCGFGDLHYGDVQNAQLLIKNKKETESTKKEEEEINKEENLEVLNPSEESKEISSAEKPKRVKNDFSPRVREVANKLLQIVVDDSPSYIIPQKLTSFLQEVDTLLNVDKRDPEILYAVLRSGLAHPYYGPPLVNGNLGKKLRERFVTLEKAMNSKLPEIKKDRKFAPCSNDQKAIAIMEEMDKRAI